MAENTPATTQVQTLNVRILGGSPVRKGNDAMSSILIAQRLLCSPLLWGF